MQDPVSMCRRFLRPAFLLGLLAWAGLTVASATVIQVSASDNGGTIKVKQRDIIALTLPANGSTGYSWAVQPNSTPLLKLKAHTSKHSSSGLVGAPSTTTYRFALTGKGTGNLLMLYSRPWEHDTPGNKEFVLHVEIQ